MLDNASYYTWRILTETSIVWMPGIGALACWLVVCSAFATRISKGLAESPVLYWLTLFSFTIIQCSYALLDGTLQGDAHSVIRPYDCQEITRAWTCNWNTAMTPGYRPLSPLIYSTLYNLFGEWAGLYIIFAAACWSLVFTLACQVERANDGRSYVVAISGFMLTACNPCLSIVAYPAQLPRLITAACVVGAAWLFSHQSAKRYYWSAAGLLLIGQLIRDECMFFAHFACCSRLLSAGAPLRLTSMITHFRQYAMPLGAVYFLGLISVLGFQPRVEGLNFEGLMHLWKNAFEVAPFWALPGIVIVALKGHARNRLIFCSLFVMIPCSVIGLSPNGWLHERNDMCVYATAVVVYISCSGLSTKVLTPSRKFLLHALFVLSLAWGTISNLLLSLDLGPRSIQRVIRDHRHLDVANRTGQATPLTRRSKIETAWAEQFDIPPSASLLQCHAKKLYQLNLRYPWDTSGYFNFPHTILKGRPYPSLEFRHILRTHNPFCKSNHRL